MNTLAKRLLLSPTLQQHVILDYPKRLVFSRLSDMFTKREQFKKEQAKFGKDREDSYRAEYEKEIQERTKNKMNWNIKNRWEQRALDDVMKNTDIKSLRFRDFNKIAE
jgi:hypothetical protein